MDPHANLAEQSTILAYGPVLARAQRARLSELRRALQGWIARGGSAPDWSAYPATSKAYRRWVSTSARFQDLAR
jgi:hypothetical protein